MSNWSRIKICYSLTISYFWNPSKIEETYWLRGPPTSQSISSPGKVIFLSVSIGNMWDLEMLSCEYYDPYESKLCKKSGPCLSWTARSTSHGGFNRWENVPFLGTFCVILINNLIFKNLKPKNWQHHTGRNFKSEKVMRPDLTFGAKKKGFID